MLVAITQSLTPGNLNLVLKRISVKCDRYAYRSILIHNPLCGIYPLATVLKILFSLLLMCIYENGAHG